MEEKQGQAQLLAAASRRLYERLLLLYPAGFRGEFGPEMAQLFGDLCRDTVRRQGRLGLARLWTRTLKDLAASAAAEYHAEWENEMRRKEMVSLVLGSILLLYSLSFAVFNILKYSLSIPIPWEPFEPIVNSANPSAITELLGLLIIAGPALAVALFVISWIRVSFDWRGDQIATIAVHKGSRLSLVLVGLCLLVGAIFTLYFMVENLPCLLGQRLYC